MTNPISTELREKDVPLMQSGAFKDTRAVIRKAADHIDAQAATIKALTEALEHYSAVYCEGSCSISDALDHDCGGCPARAALAAAKEPT